MDRAPADSQIDGLCFCEGGAVDSAGRLTRWTAAMPVEVVMACLRYEVVARQVPLATTKQKTTELNSVFGLGGCMRRNAATLLAFLALYLSCASVAFALPYEGVALNGGVNARQYWIDPTSTNLGHYESDIQLAVQSWNDTQSQGTWISFTRTLNYCCTSVVDHYVRNYGAAWTGVTGFFHSDGSLAMPSLGDAPTSNWDYAEVSIDNVDLANIFDLRVRAVIAHEFGHGLGLDHSPLECALMFENVVMGSTWDRCHQFFPNTDDVNSAKMLQP